MNYVTSYLPSWLWNSWIQGPNSVACRKFLTEQHDFFDITFDFWQTWRLVVSLRQLALWLLFMFIDGIWSVPVIAILMAAHQQMLQGPLENHSRCRDVSGKDKNADIKNQITQTFGSTTGGTKLDGEDTKTTCSVTLPFTNYNHMHEQISYTHKRSRRLNASRENQPWSQKGKNCTRVNKNKEVTTT